MRSKHERAAIQQRAREYIDRQMGHLPEGSVSPEDYEQAVAKVAKIARSLAEANQRLREDQ